jgi:hypothetical protein
MTSLVRQLVIREVNARIRELSDRFGAGDGTYILLCECGRDDCTERVEVPAPLYREKQGFLLAPGHVRPEPARPRGGAEYALAH